MECVKPTSGLSFVAMIDREWSTKNRVRGADRRPIDSAGDLVPGRDVTLWTLHADPEVVVPSDLLEIRNLDDAGKNRPVEIVLYLRKGV